VAESLVSAALLLRANCYEAVVFDQYLLETEPHETEITLGQMGLAIPIQVNLAISGSERVVREVCAALRRRQREESNARQAAIAQLQSELNGTVTALLLSSELALEIPGLPPEASEKLRSIHELVKQFRGQLESTALGREAELVIM
jgi:hypothetical protein